VTKEQVDGRGVGARLLAGTAALLFVASAFLQLNDPDPMRWLLLYGAAAIASALFVVRALPSSVYLGLAVVAGGWAALVAPGVLAVTRLQGDEEERELAGLLLVAAVSFQLARARRRARGVREVEAHD